MREIVELKEKISDLQSQRDADRELMAGLRERLQQMETELNDYKEIAEQTCNVSQWLQGERWVWRGDGWVWQTAGCCKHNAFNGQMLVNIVKYMHYFMISINTPQCVGDHFITALLFSGECFVEASD
jgi:hypothetical protein